MYSLFIIIRIILLRLLHIVISVNKVFYILCVTKQDAIKREVFEETGLEMEPTTLVLVQCASKAWFRFVLTGRIVGGTLKTPAQADAESLQAKWVSDPSQLSLRGNDILPIIERGQTYYSNSEPQHPRLLPSVRPHHKLLLRLVVCIRQKSTCVTVYLCYLQVIVKH